MSSPPFKFNKDQIEAIKLKAGFMLLHTKTFSLPTFYPSLFQKLPEADRSCRSCGTPFIPQTTTTTTPGQGYQASPLEKPVVMPCGHICGSRCLEASLDPVAPKCLICKRPLPFRERGTFGVHGCADKPPGLFPMSDVRAEGSQTASLGGGVKPRATTTRTAAATPMQSNNDGVAITSGRNDNATSSASHAQAVPISYLASQIQAAIDNGSELEDIEAAKILVDISARR